MARYDEELLRFRQQDALRAAEKHRLLKTTASAHAHQLELGKALGGLLVRLGQWLEGRRAFDDQPVRVHRQRPAH